MFRLLVLAVLLAACGCARAHPPFAQMEQPTSPMIFPAGGLCSGTAVEHLGAKAIATTRHCLAMPGMQVRWRGILVNIRRVLLRGENALVLIDRDPCPCAELGPLPDKGDEVWLFGNPIGLHQVLRGGRVGGAVIVSNLSPYPALLIDYTGWNGDSGAGILDNDGRLIAIHYGSLTSRWHEEDDAPIEWYMPFAYPLNFTPEQWAEARQ